MTAKETKKSTFKLSAKAALFDLMNKMDPEKRAELLENMEERANSCSNP
jgi:hypothetical protein